MLVSQKFLIFIVDSGAQLPTKFKRKGDPIMKKLKKRLLAVALTAAATTAMAMPSFATNYYKITYRPFLASGSSQNYLNLDRSSTSVNPRGRKLTLWRTSTPSTDQFFDEVYETVGGVSGYVIKFNSNNAYAVNRNTSGNGAILWTWSNITDFRDSALVASNRTDQATFKLRYGSGAGMYLCYAADCSGSNVMFTNSGNNTWDN